MRRSGKSYAQNKMKEAMLNAGKKVLVCTPESITLQRRKKHLTLIENIPRREKPMTVIYDDYFL